MRHRLAFTLLTCCSICLAAEQPCDSTVQSQVEVTPLVRRVASTVDSITTPGHLTELQHAMLSNLEYCEYTRKTAGREREIRWRRTADEILRDRYVYEGKACTDLTVVFIALCRAHGLEPVFVKVYRTGRVHSLVEVAIGGTWYIYDPSRYRSEPMEGRIEAGTAFQGWTLWRKGRDSWDIGLCEYDDIRTMYDTLKERVSDPPASGRGMLPGAM